MVILGYFLGGWDTPIPPKNENPPPIFFFKLPHWANPLASRGEAAILLHKVLRIFLKPKISITTEPIGFSISGKLYKCPLMVLGYAISDLRFLDGFMLFQ